MLMMMMVRNEDDDDDDDDEDDDDDDDDDGEEARSKAMHESAFRSDAWRRVPKRGPYPWPALNALRLFSYLLSRLILGIS